MNDTPEFYVDFNEMVGPGLVLLSQTKERTNSNGDIVTFREGMCVRIFMDDPSPEGDPEFLVAEGKVELNLHRDWSKHVRWVCRISGDGIRRASRISHAAFTKDAG